MRKMAIIITVAVLFCVPMGLGGCGTKDKAPSTTAVEPQKKEAQPADKPAADKPAADTPKDHPAH